MRKIRTRAGIVAKPTAYERRSRHSRHIDRRYTAIANKLDATIAAVTLIAIIAIILWRSN